MIIFDGSIGQARKVLIEDAHLSAFNQIPARSSVPKVLALPM
jgi:hypothetical protein